MKHTTKKLMVLWLALAAGARAQEKAPDEKAETIQIVYEVFSLPLTEAAAIQRSGINDKDFYTKMVEGVRAQKVTQDVFLMGRTQSGNRTTIEQTAQHIYNTEAEPPELPNQVAGGAGYQQNAEGKLTAANFPVTPATPSAFATRNVGQSLEIEAQANAENTQVQLQLHAQDVKLIQRDAIGQGMSKVEMPRFSNQKITTSLPVDSGKPTYLGTISAPKELQPEEGEERVWFAFITANIVAQ